MATVFIENLKFSPDGRNALEQAMNLAQDIKVVDWTDGTSDFGTQIQLCGDMEALSNMPFDKLYLNMNSPDLVSREFAKLATCAGFAGGCVATVLGSILLAKSIKALKAKKEAKAKEE